MRNRIEVIESPFAGPDRATLDRNASYLDECLKDSLASAIKHMGFTSTDDAARELAKRARDTVHAKHERNQKEQEQYFAQFVKE